jgi:hypothetical protein
MSDKEKSIRRRQFLQTTVAATAGASALTTFSQQSTADEHPVPTKRDYFELRIHRVSSAEKAKIVAAYLKNALVPALNRQGMDIVGVFQPIDEEQFDFYTLITYPSLEMFGMVNGELERDQGYQKAAAEYFAQPLKDPSFVRIESRLMKSFAGLPVLQLPSQSKEKAPRIFELRIYESHNEHAARRKVEMFNKGEIKVMQDVEMAPVFFGETLISSDVPNLTYMLSADDAEAHKKHWDAFKVHPEWQKMKGLERYKGTVSKIRSVMLKPTSFSHI